MNLLFHRLLQQKVNVIMTFIKAEPATDDVLPTAVLHKYLNNELKVLIIFPLSCTEFPEFSMFREIPTIPGFPGLWPPC